MTTYTELKQQLLDYAETDNQVLTDVILNDIINHAENRIFRTIELDNTNDKLTIIHTTLRVLVVVVYDPQ